MPSVPLPIYTQQRTPADAERGLIPIDRSRPYASCQWLEGGLAFDWRSLHACLVIHHNRGFPFLAHYNGGPIDTDAVLAARAKIIRENQTTGHEACRGCPYLITRRWPKPRFPFRLLGIAQFAHCNIECSYCYLQWQDPAVFKNGYKPYAVLPAIQELIRKKQLDPRSTVDWGGGEPTIYREFDDVLRLVTQRGAITFIHTNGTRLPKPIRDGLLTKRIHLICSVDAGTRQTWKRIKNKDLLDEVWNNLELYIQRGCRVILKYIMMDENCAEAELTAFLRRARQIGARELVLDIDYTRPNPSRQVIAGLRTLKRMAVMRGMYVTFGSTGARFTPEIEIDGELGSAAAGTYPQRIEYRLREWWAYFARHGRNVARRLR